jgi:aryl-alcohol dehydrogenase-like predicted oxidoreductase
VGLIDTAEFYGPGTSEQLIDQALWPYPEGLVMATKGLTHPPDRWGQPGEPGRLREAVEGSLRRLRQDRIALYQLARVDPTVPADEQVGVLAELRAQGKIGQVGLSEVGVDQLEAARELVPVASVQNRYSLADRAGEPVPDHCEGRGSRSCPGFPWAGPAGRGGRGAGGGGGAPSGDPGPGGAGLAADHQEGAGERRQMQGVGELAGGPASDGPRMPPRAEAAPRCRSRGRVGGGRRGRRRRSGPAARP